MSAQPKATARSQARAARRTDPIATKTLHKREFISRVAAVADLPQSQVRPNVDITLAELGRAIAAGETLALPPFGRARVSRQKTIEGGEVLIIRLRRRVEDERAWAWADQAKDQGGKG